MEGLRYFFKSISPLIMIWMILLLNSCNAKPEWINPSPSTNPSKVDTSTFVVINTPLRTITAQPTLINTDIPIIIPSQAPFPTLPSEEALAQVRELLETNGGCQFPCWWGITPGKSTWTEVERFLRPMAFSISKHQHSYDNSTFYETHFAIDEFPSTNNSLSVIFTLEIGTDVIEQINTGQDFLIRPFLDSEGQPEQIFMLATERPGMGPGHFEIDLFYPSQGILAAINGESTYERRNEEDYTILCQDQLEIGGTGIGFILFPPDKLTYEDIRVYLGDYPTRPLEETTNMTNEEFFDLLMGNSPNKCLEIPMCQWGY